MARAGRLEWATLVLATAAVICAVAFGGSAAPQVPTQSVKSRAGDTLWGLATQHPVTGMTTAETARLIARINGVEPGALPTGSTILVPRVQPVVEVAMR